MEVHLPPLLLWVVCEVLGSVGSVSQLWSSQAVCGSMSKVFRYELWGHKTQEVMASGCHDDGARLAATLVSASSQLPRSPAPEHSPTQAPWRKDMRGQKILRTGCELCSMGKLLFNCRVPSLSTTLKRKQKKGSGHSLSLRRWLGGQFMFWILYLRYLQCSWIIFSFGDRVLLCWTSQVWTQVILLLQPLDCWHHRYISSSIFFILFIFISCIWVFGLHVCLCTVNI